MLNPSQIKSFKDIASKNRQQITHHEISFAPFDMSTFDYGEVLEEFNEAGENVIIDDPVFRLGKPVNNWIYDQAKGGCFWAKEKTIRRFQQVEITGWRSLITPSGFYSSSIWFKQTDITKLQSSVYEGYAVVNEQAYRAIGKSSSLEIVGKGFFLTYLEPGNHGAFIFRALPKLLYFLETGIKIDYLIVPHRSDSLRELLELFELNHLPVFTCKESINLKFETVYIVDDFDSVGCLDSQSVLRFCKLVDKVIQHTPQSSILGKKLYISRSLQRGVRPHYRPLINELDLEKSLKAKGFYIYYPEIHSFFHQIKTFASAQQIVGPSGSGMLNTVFSPRHANVIDLESFTNTVPQHANIYGSCNKKYGFVFGQFFSNEGPEQFRSWTLCIDDVLEGLEYFL